MALGAGTTARAATFVANASCTMQDRVLQPMYMFSRTGQAFGWGGSPVINTGDFMKGFYDDTAELPNMQAWIMNGIKVFDSVGRHGNPTAIVVSDPSQTPAETIAASAHLKTKCVLPVSVREI